jgi:hypothetical protein
MQYHAMPCQAGAADACLVIDEKAIDYLGAVRASSEPRRSAVSHRCIARRMPLQVHVIPTFLIWMPLQVCETLLARVAQRSDAVVACRARKEQKAAQHNIHSIA